MVDLRDRPQQLTRALLVGVCLGHEEPAETESLLGELSDLVDTLGIPVVGRVLVRCAKPVPGLLMGRGKAGEIVEQAKASGADVVVIDHDLSPAQQRNWEELSGLCVIDREEVILDIFAKRARTREARLQVGLARMEYSLPRLTRAWAHLSRQSGGGGTGGRGEGEMQLEVDRRLVRRKIARLKSELRQVRKQRATRRKERLRVPVPTASIVGYTNAGKSSLLRALTGAEVFVEDKLFATLDTTTRRLELPNGQRLLLTDTVGFVRRLPHRLVESFMATLEEAVLSDFLVHVVDASHPRAEAFVQTTLDVLAELGADGKRMVTVFNKVDLVTDRAALLPLRTHFPEAVFASVRSGEGLDAVRSRLADLLNGRVHQRRYRFPPDRPDLVSSLHRQGKVLAISYRPDGVVVDALVPARLDAAYRGFQSKESPEGEAHAGQRPSAGFA
jgi:GTP-binding protein HflX